MSQRISIIGSTGAGKSTLARQIAQRSGIAAIDLDWLYWKPGWVAETSDTFRAKVACALDKPDWVASGNYRSVRDIVWGRAQMLIWLDYPLLLSTSRLVRRVLLGLASGDEVVPGCRETIRNTFLSRDSALWVGLRTHQKRGQVIASDLQNTYKHLDVLRFRHPCETAAWLSQTKLVRETNI